MTSSFLGDFQTPSPCHHVIIRLAHPPSFVSVNSEKNFSVTKQRTPVILILTFLRKPYFACSFVHWLQNCFCFPSTTFRIWVSQIQYEKKCNRIRGWPTISVKRTPPAPQAITSYMNSPLSAASISNWASSHSWHCATCPDYNDNHDHDRWQ